MIGFTRRTFVKFSTLMAVLAPVTPALLRLGNRPGDDEYVVVDGWILKNSDLKKS